MRLAEPFYQLPVLFDIERLQAEVATLPAEAWGSHPDKLSGNSAARLISAGGAETDSVHGQMLATPWLAAMPYARQVLAGFGVVWSRSRLMRLAPGARVPEHADINYHWHTRVRLHIPIQTRPQVRFHCDGQSVHMAAGEDLRQLAPSPRGERLGCGSHPSGRGHHRHRRLLAVRVRPPAAARAVAGHALEP